MTLGIVGSEAAKFTPETEAKAREQIRKTIIGIRATKVVSGKCHLGGIDIFAIEEAKKLGIETEEFPPRIQSWPGYRDRNLKIVDASDKVMCITVAVLPSTYKGMRFDAGCYHCGPSAPPHVKSGGCWTMHKAREADKDWQLVIID